MRRLTLTFVLAALCLISLLLLASPASAGNTGSLQVTVNDPNAKALVGATLILTDPKAPSFRREEKSDRKGRAIILGLTPGEYVFRMEMDGHRPYESNFAAAAGEVTQKEVTLEPLGAGAEIRKGGTGAPQVVEKKKDPWALFYNEAVPLYQEDRDEEALARLEAALQAKTDYAPALALKGIISEEHGKCEEAIPFLKQAYGADPNVTTVLGPLVRCLEKTGRSDEASTFRKAQSETKRSKADLYNDAVTRINAGDDAGAGPLLEQAIQQDATFAAAQYQYGLILFHRGDVPGAVARLQIYLKLAPGGEFAADATGLIKALAP